MRLLNAFLTLLGPFLIWRGSRAVVWCDRNENYAAYASDFIQSS